VNKKQAIERVRRKFPEAFAMNDGIPHIDPLEGLRSGPATWKIISPSGYFPSGTKFLGEGLTTTQAWKQAAENIRRADERNKKP